MSRGAAGGGHAPVLAVTGLGVASAGACALAMAMGIGRFAYTPMLPPMLEESGIGLSAAGLIASANFLGYLVGALLATHAAFARRRVAWLRIGLAASAFTTAAMALDVGAGGWAAVRLASGIASAFVLVFTSAVVFEVIAREGRPMLGSLLYAGVGVGIAASALLVYVGLEAGASAALLWWLLAGLSVLLAIAPWRSLDRPPGVVTPPHADPGRSAAQRRALSRLVWSYGCLGFGYVITATFLVVMVRRLPDARALEFWTWAVVGLAGAPSNWLWAKVAARTGSYAAIVAAFVLEAIGVALAAAGQGPAALLVGAALLGGTFMAITALGLATARELAPDRPDQTIARMTVAFSLGQIAGPAMGGWLAERSGSFAAPSWLAAAVLLVGAALAAAAARDG
ncbi:MAG: YbfB/YjiJ family MFS transporter [Burkholderiaceae bacterium]|nr:YbfB/YjiJ family MFS transporter [Burkholderiaceae bacterium]MEB2351459.1 YbfB/YjiJ family MFS transporter [Burkholderiaceae bacterium]